MESLTETALVGATEISLLVSSDAPDSSVSVCVCESEQQRAEEPLLVWSNNLVVISDACFTTFQHLLFLKVRLSSYRVPT